MDFHLSQFERFEGDRYVWGYSGRKKHPRGTHIWWGNHKHYRRMHIAGGGDESETRKITFTFHFVQI